MDDSVPAREECLSMLKEAGCAENVIKHCLAVEEVALRIACLARADEKLVRAGALLHDIGRSKTHGVNHAVEGGMIARKLGLDSRIVHIIERHVGAGITTEEAKKLGLPTKDYTPVSLEEKIVAHSDNLVEEDGKAPVMGVVIRFREEGYHEAADKILELHRELSDICGVDLDDI